MLQNRLIMIAVITVIICSCVSLIGGLGLGFGLNEIINLPGLDSVRLASPQPAAPGTLLYADDFSAERWEVVEDADHRKGYDNGRYFILAETPGFDYWSTAGQTFSDFALDVETNQLAGPNNNSYGVLLRYQDHRNFYKFEISGDGYYTFSKVIDGQLLDIIPWQESTWLEPGNSPNKLRIEAAGAQFTFYANDQWLDAVVDPAFGTGDIGLVVGVFDQGGAHIAFDNLKITAVQGQ
jgi:hypothetical protein